MSREQRRSDNRKQGKPTSSNRRTPQKVKTGRSIPTMPLIILGGVLLIGGMLAFLIWQAGSSTQSTSAADKEEQDDSADLPGTFVPSQGRGHFSGGLIGHVTVPFCEGVTQSELAEQRSGVPFGETPGATRTAVTPTTTPTPSVTPENATAHGGTAAVPLDCHSSNPPSSGEHLGVQRNVDIGGGLIINIPADPDVYPHDVEIPRDAIAHGLEHAGVYVGWNCADNDQPCLDTVAEIEDLANSRIENNSDRVQMSINRDLPEGTVGLASWTRVMTFPFAEYDENAVEDFIGTHSCRFDPEGFC